MMLPSSCTCLLLRKLWTLSYVTWRIFYSDTFPQFILSPFFVIWYTKLLSGFIIGHPGQCQVPLLVINKHENIYVFVGYWNDESIPGWMLSVWSEGIECMAEGETEDLMKKRAIFKCSAFFCMSLHISLYGVMTVSISCLNFKHLSVKWFIWNI